MADWSISNYQVAATAQFAALDPQWGSAAWVALGQNGASPTFQQFKTSQEASDAYQQIITSPPAGAVYVALFDRAVSQQPTGIVDESYFGGMQPETQTIKVKRPIAPVIATAVGLGLAVFAGRKRRH